jgi:AcrR family transcriptional regulator
MEDVAREASLSRTTVYRCFENRDELLIAVVGREFSRLAAEAGLYLERFDDIASWVVEGMLFIFRELPKRPLLAMLINPEGQGVANRLVLRSADLLEIGVASLRPVFEPAERQGLLREGLRIEVLIEWQARILASFLAAPSRLVAEEEDMRLLLRSLVLPAVLKNP